MNHPTPLAAHAVYKDHVCACLTSLWGQDPFEIWLFFHSLISVPCVKDSLVNVCLSPEACKLLQVGSHILYPFKSGRPLRPGSVTYMLWGLGQMAQSFEASSAPKSVKWVWQRLLPIHPNWFFPLLYKLERAKWLPSWASVSQPFLQPGGWSSSYT